MEGPRYWKGAPMTDAHLLSLDRAAEISRIQEIAHLGFWEWEVPTDTVRWSTHLFELFGVDPGEVEHLDFQTFLGVVDERDRSEVKEYIDRAYETGTFETFEFRARGSDGSVAWFLSQGDVTVGEDGEPVRMTGTVQEITERKRLEQELAERTRRLTEAQELAAIGHWTLDMRTEEVTGSKEMYDILGLPQGEPYSSDRFFELVHPEDREAAQAAMEKAMATGEPASVDYRIERPDGQQRWAESRLIPEFEAGEPVQIRGTVQDVTERKEIEQSLREAKQAAEEADRAKSMFLANVSHEVRTPMTAILGFANLLLEQDLGAEAREDVETIRSSGEHLLSILDDILDLSKIQAGRLTLEETAFDLRRVVEDTLEMLSAQAGSKDIDLAYQIDDDVPEAIVGDGSRLRQVLANLVSNGVKFTENGGVTVTVSREPGDPPWIVMSVEDTGIGIPEDAINELFQPFTQVDASATRRHEGTGLGLAISKRLVELMEGTIEVESTEGEGSTFTVRVPADPAPAPPQRRWDVAPEAFQGARVLVVDDNATNRTIIQRRVELWGMDVTSAASGDEALELLREGENFQVVLSDFSMPGMTGADLARRIANELDDPPPVVLLTSMPARAEQDAPPDIAKVIDKPVKPDVLFDTLAEVLDADVAPSEPDHQFDEQTAKEHPLDILLVEDSDTNRLVQRRILQQLGYEPEIAVDGRAALDRFEAGERFDLVFMDVQMPRMDGLEATGRIRDGLAEDEQPRIVALTAHAAESDRKRCLEAGMDGYLAKPIEIGELVAVLTEGPSR